MQTFWVVTCKDSESHKTMRKYRKWEVINRGNLVTVIKHIKKLLGSSLGSPVYHFFWHWPRFWLPLEKVEFFFFFNKCDILLNKEAEEKGLLWPIILDCNPYFWVLCLRLSQFILLKASEIWAKSLAYSFCIINWLTILHLKRSLGGLQVSQSKKCL